MNAYLLTGDDRYLDPWRKQMDVVNSQRKLDGGQAVYPRMRGDDGWYDFTPQPYSVGASEIAYLSQRPDEVARAPASGWKAYLERHRAGLPADVAALVDELAFVAVTTADGRQLPVDGPHLTLALAPGAGTRLTLTMKRYSQPPTLAWPW